MPVLMRQYEHISSCSNQLVVRLSKLSDSKYRKQEKMFLCEGIKLVRDALSHNAPVSYILVNSDSVSEFSDMLDSLQDVKIAVLDNAPFMKISTEKAPQGIIAVIAETKDVASYEKIASERIFMCDGVRDPGNLGTIVRAAAAMGFDRVVISDCADITNPKTVRASMGGIFRIHVSQTEDISSLIDSLRKGNRRVFSATLSDNCVSLGSFELLPSDVFLVGNEGHGLSEELISQCTGSVKIDMAGDTESLNVSSASSIIMWEMSKAFSRK